MRNKKDNMRKKEKKGEFSMRKHAIMMVIATILVTFGLTGCTNPFKTDENHAKVSISTESGFSDTIQSVNGAGKSASGQSIALRYKSEFVLKKGDKLYLAFNCDACGYTKEFVIDYPWANTISCDCPEKIDEAGNAKEYFAISVSFKE